MPKWTAVEEVEWNGTTITRFRVRNPDEPGERVLVRAGGNHVLDYEDHSISLNGYKHERETLIDLDPASGDDIKECVIECYSGGAHCCYRVFVVKLLAWGPEIVADIDARNGLALKAPSEPSGEWLFDIPDQTFDYWKAPHAESPMPSVYYRLHDGELRVALEHMGPRATNDVQSMVKSLEFNDVHNGASSSNAAVWKAALEFVYGGEEAKAWEFLSLVVAKKKSVSEQAVNEFKQLLDNDPWYQDVKDARAAAAANKPLPASRIGKSGKGAKQEP
jgi:hypothetical protein